MGTAIRKAARKTGKWGGAVLTLLLLVVWIGSGWWYGEVEWLAPFHWMRLGASEGSLFLSFGSWDSGLSHSTLSFEPRANNWNGWRDLIGRWDTFRTLVPYGWSVACPIWVVMGIVFASTSLVWRTDVRAMRRAREGLCAACGYDLVGLAGTAAGAVCPECGRVAPR